MTAVDDLDVVIEQYHRAAADFIKGDPEPYKRLFSQRNDVTLGNPFGPFARGSTQIVETMKRAASHYRDGEAIGFDTISKYVTDDLAYIVEVEAQVQGGRTGGSRASESPCDEHLPSGRRPLEARPSARRSDNHRPGSGVRAAEELTPHKGS